jgi:hypothetical protein
MTAGLQDRAAELQDMAAGLQDKAAGLLYCKIWLQDCRMQDMAAGL